jgi:Domain of unknown function (DUF4145)
MERSLWTATLSKHWAPQWKCPICKRGHTVLTPKSLVSKENTASARQHDHEAWDPEWVEYVFTAWATCSNDNCKQPFALSGTGGVAPDFDDNHGTEWHEYFRPGQCHPMPEIIELPAKCPALVRDALREAFALFWRQPESCAGRVRVALECLMDHLGVPKRKKGKAGKFYDLTLHGRLDHFATKNAAIGAHLMALKWVGNAGSHNGKVSSADLLDAFEVLEHTLAEVIEQRSAKVSALAKKLTKKHGR